MELLFPIRAKSDGPHHAAGLGEGSGTISAKGFYRKVPELYTLNLHTFIFFKEGVQAESSPKGKAWP